MTEDEMVGWHAHSESTDVLTKGLLYRKITNYFLRQESIQQKKKP